MQAINKIQSIKVGDLKPFERNSRLHDEGQIKQLSNSIKEWGFTIPILVDEDNVVLAGHARLMAAKEMSMDTVPCLVADGWSEEQKRAYVIADNKLAENSEWDMGIYFSELKELSNIGFDVSLAGIDAELDSLTYTPNLEPVTQYTEVTADDVGAASETVGKITPSGQKVVELICPHCGEDFEFAGM